MTSEWNYDGSDGALAPAQWKERWPAAGGKEQSPIDLPTPPTGTYPLLTDYRETDDATLWNNGHTFQVTFGKDERDHYTSKAGTLTFDDTTYQLRQFHFHFSSEHTRASSHFDMEVHLVHAAIDPVATLAALDHQLGTNTADIDPTIKEVKKKYAVIGVFIKTGSENSFLKKFWSELLAQDLKEHLKDVDVKSPNQLNADDLLPPYNQRALQTYRGSFTTPPCTEGVRWLMMSEVIEASAEQIAAFKDAMHHHNNRPIQPINQRAIHPCTFNSDSISGSQAVPYTFNNHSTQTIEVTWVDSKGDEAQPVELGPGQSAQGTTYVGHRFIARDKVSKKVVDTITVQPQIRVEDDL